MPGARERHVPLTLVALLRSSGKAQPSTLVLSSTRLSSPPRLISSPALHHHPHQPAGAQVARVGKQSRAREMVGAAPPLAAVRLGGLLRVSCSASTAPASKSNGGPKQQQQQQLARRRQQQQLARRRQQQQLPAPPLSSAAVPLLLAAAALPPDALAAGGEFGILEGRSFALLHPLVMGGLFGYTLWAGYLGWQWRRVRTVQDEINDLKKQLKPAAAAAPAAVGAGDASSSAAPPPPAPKSPAEIKIDELTEVTPTDRLVHQKRGAARLLQERNC